MRGLWVQELPTARQKRKAFSIATWGPVSSVLQIGLK